MTAIIGGRKALIITMYKMMNKITTINPGASIFLKGKYWAYTAKPVKIFTMITWTSNDLKAVDELFS